MWRLLHVRGSGAESMCGIAGTLELDGSPRAFPARIKELERMAHLLGHRGPDEAGYFLDRCVAMVAVRLGINDLENGQQPVGDPGQRYWIVYNGEIYNAREIRARLEQRGHRFHTRCDTEVALRAWMEWGEEAPALFDGGYAFAVYDRHEQVVFLVRDRYGKRPLFYRANSTEVIFGSEIKAFLAREDVALRWDARGVASIFAKWTPFGDETPFEGVKQLPAGTVLRISPSGFSRRTYAVFGVPTVTIESNFEDAAVEAASLLRDSVRLRLRSDVEVGVLLSGGLDSTVIAHLVRTEQPGRLQSFSIAFADAQFDESADQCLVVDAFGLSHTSIVIGAHDIADSIQAALWHAEVPQFRTAFVPMFLLARTVREHGIKVVLSGEGADEVFLGYDIFKEARLRAMWESLAPDERRARVRRLYPYLPHFSDANARTLEALYARSSGVSDDPLFSHATRLENARLALRLLRTDADGLEGLRSAMALMRELDAASAVRKAQWIEFHTLLQGYLLSSQGDRMMFAHGVEQRCPFLSQAVVSFIGGLPEEYLLSEEGDEKRLLKHAFRDQLPRRILSKYKQPYRAPDTSSFLHADADGNGRFADWVEDLLSDRQLEEIGLLEPAATSQFLTKLRRTPRERVSPREDQAFMLLLSLAVLDRQFIHREGVLRPTTHPPLTRVADLSGQS